MTHVESDWPIRSKTCRCFIATRPAVLLGYRLRACVWACLAMFSWTKLIFFKKQHCGDVSAWSWVKTGLRFYGFDCYWGHSFVKVKVRIRVKEISVSVL